MIRWQAILPKLPKSKNELMRTAKMRGRGGRLVKLTMAKDREEWLLLLNALKRAWDYPDSGLWWRQADDLDSAGKVRQVAIHVRVATPRPRDAMNPFIAGLVDSLHERRVLRNPGVKDPRFQDWFQGVGILVDDGPRYVPLCLTSWTKVPKGKECTMIRIRDHQDYGGIDADMDKAVQEVNFTVLGHTRQAKF